MINSGIKQPIIIAQSAGRYRGQGACSAAFPNDDAGYINCVQTNRQKMSDGAQRGWGESDKNWQQFTGNPRRAQPAPLMPSNILQGGQGAGYYMPLGPNNNYYRPYNGQVYGPGPTGTK
jgi:hypothetical protein